MELRKTSAVFCTGLFHVEIICTRTHDRQTRSLFNCFNHTDEDLIGYGKTDQAGDEAFKGQGEGRRTRHTGGCSTQSVSDWASELSVPVNR